MFQKTRYNWDFEEKGFKGISFPVDQSYAEYLNWKGYQTEQEIKDAESDYGINEYAVEMLIPLS